MEIVTKYLDDTEQYKRVIDRLISLCIDQNSNLVAAINEADTVCADSYSLKHITISIHELPSGLPEIRVNRRVMN